MIVHIDNIQLVLEKRGDDFFFLETLGPVADPLKASFLRMLQGRAIAQFDRTSIKEFDYFLRTDPKRPAFDKIAPEHLALMEFAARVKKEVLGDKKKKTDAIYIPEIHGEVELMGSAERYELFEELLSRLDENFKIEQSTFDVQNMHAKIECQNIFDLRLVSEKICPIIQVNAWE